MSDALRSSVIELDWKINNRSLERANEETDKILLKLHEWKVLIKIQQNP